MNFFGVLLLCLAVVCVRSQDQFKEKLEAMTETCKAETNASDADVETVLKHEPVDTAEGKCLRACFMKNFGVLNAEGKLDLDAAISLITVVAKDDEEKQKIGIELTKTCAEIAVSADHCEAAEEYSNCFTTKAKAEGLLLEV